MNKRILILIPLSIFTFTLLLSSPVIHAQQTSANPVYIIEFYCGGDLAAIGLIGGNVASAYPPLILCHGRPVFMNDVVVYIARSVGLQGVQAGAEYLLKYDGVVFKIRVYRGMPGYHLLPLLYAILVALVVLAGVAVAKREELEVF